MVNHTIVICLVLLCYLDLPVAAQTHPQASPEYQKNIELHRRIRLRLEQDFKTSPVRPDYPMTRAMLSPANQPESAAAASDSTPPSPPANLEVSTESIHSFFVRWSLSSDPESGIDYYAYAIGSQPGEADVRWWQSTGINTRTYAQSLKSLELPEGARIFVSVRAVNGAGIDSETVVSDSISLNWQDLGLPEYELTIDLAEYGFDSTGVNVIEGWTADERATLEHFIARMNPIIKEIYGPPSRQYTVTLVKNLWYSGSNIFFPSSNEVHMSDFYPQLLTHELLHAYRDNVILSTDDWWQYHPQLSGFEEGFAQGASYACMNRYIEFYPGDAIVDSTYLFGSSMHWDYDYRNTEAITTEDFWSDFAGLGLFWERYELGAAAMRKIHLEDQDFFRKFNAAYYARLNADHDLTTSRDLMIDIIAAVLPEVEMQPARDWLSHQRIFDCRIEPGKKIWIRTQHYPWDEYIIFQRICYYETFENGSDWSYWDEASGSWAYHSLNGSSGTGLVTAPDGETLWQNDLLIEPVGNPPDYFGFGSDVLNFSTDSDLEPWPLGDAQDYLLNLTGLKLYQFDIDFGGATTQVHRVVGNELKNTRGVFGGISNAANGVIHINHENFPEEPPLQVVNGAFWGERLWASVPNAKTGGTDSQAGRVNIRFEQDDGKRYLAQRNIDWGSWNGDQAFLFDTEEMVLDSSVASSVPPTGQPRQFVVEQNYPNPFNPTTSIHYRIPKTAHVEVIIYNLLGQKIRRLFSGTQSAGAHTQVWDARNDAGVAVASGAYFFKVETGDLKTIRKMLLLQ